MEATVLTNTNHPVSLFQRSFLQLKNFSLSSMTLLFTKRKLLYHNKWIFVTELCNRRKGKVKLPLYYRGKAHEAYLAHTKVQITVSRKDIYLVLVYGIILHTMMLATIKEIQSKDNAIKITKLYFSKWHIEEYFRCKKQIFQFENFRIRKFKTINALIFYIILYIAF